MKPLTSLAVALLAIATGLLAIYGISHRWHSEPLGPQWHGTRNNGESSGMATPILGVVHPGGYPAPEEWSPPPMPPGNWYGGLK